MRAASAKLIRMTEPFTLSAHIDYLHVNCAVHKVQCHVTYLGTDPIMPQLNFKCPKCDSSRTFKLDGVFSSGFPTEASPNWKEDKS